MQITTDFIHKETNARTDSRRALQRHWLSQVKLLQKPQQLRLSDTFWWWASNSVPFLTTSPRKSTEQYSQRLRPFRVSRSGVRTLSLSHTLLGAPPSSERGTPMHRLIELGIRGVMDILGLDRSLPIQSQTQYLDENIRVTAEWQQRGNEVATCCCFVAALLPLLLIRILSEATNWQQVATSKNSMFNGGLDCDAR